MKIKLSALLVLAMAGQMQAIPAAQAAPDLEAGKRAFAKCASCHQVGRSARAGFGPHLHGVFGRKAGSTADFHYSPAMKNARIVWTDQTLAAFLKAPGDVVPGNKMRFWGIGSDEQIANLLAYLHSVQ